jgi:L-serine dehydratase
MKPISIFNDVLGPIMRGPSSSHTAGPFHIGKLARALLDDEPRAVVFAFDPVGSFAQVYQQQGSDLGFVAGLLGWDITDERFARARELAPTLGLRATFVVESLASATHPNTVEIRLASQHDKQLTLVAQSIGGGAIILTHIQGWQIHITGDAYDTLIECAPQCQAAVLAHATRDGNILGSPQVLTRDDVILIHVKRAQPLDANSLTQIKTLKGVRQTWVARPVFFVPRGRGIFASAAEMLAFAQARGMSLGRVALEYESTLLGLSPDEILAETVRRFEVMRNSVMRGLDPNTPPLKLLQPSAGQVMQAESAKRLVLGGIHTRAAARALAVMHVNGSGGIVCAAPTAGSAGVIPGVLVTLVAELGLEQSQVALALLAASIIGVIVATRATFAAEVAGCQVEIGAAGAMAAAAIVDAAGGNAKQAMDAAAIAFQNCMGLVCDPVQGRVEIPCHTRNAAAAGSAFICADLAMGGYVNPISLDETIDAVYAVGQMMPSELRCTARGGLAVTPSALAMQA